MKVQKLGQKVAHVMMILSIVLPKNSHASEITEASNSFVDQQISLLASGALLSPDTLLSELQIDANDSRLNNIDQMFHSMDRSTLNPQSVEKLSALLKVKPQHLMGLLNQNPAFMAQFHDLILLMETGSASQGPAFNQRIIENLIGNLSDWLDQNSEHDSVVIAELRQVMDSLGELRDSRLLEFDLQSSNSLLALLNSDLEPKNSPLYVPGTPNIETGEGYVVDESSNIVLASNMNNANKKLVPAETFNDEIKDEISSSVVAENIPDATIGEIKTTSSPKEKPVKPDPIKSIIANLTQHSQPQALSPVLNPHDSNPLDYNPRLSQNSAAVQQEDKSDLCANFGIDCPDSQQVTQTQSSVLTEAREFLNKKDHVVDEVAIGRPATNLIGENARKPASKKKEKKNDQSSPTATSISNQAQSATEEVCNENTANSFIENMFERQKTQKLSRLQSAREWVSLYSARVAEVDSKTAQNIFNNNARRGNSNQLLNSLYLATAVMTSKSPACTLLKGKTFEAQNHNANTCLDFSTLKAQTAEVVKGLLSHVLDDVSRSVTDTSNGGIKIYLEKTCGNIESNLAKSLCLVEHVLGNPAIDKALFQSANAPSRSALLFQMQNCQGPNQVGSWIAERERDMRKLARSCGSWEPRVIDRMSKGSDNNDDVLSKNIQTFIDANYLDLMSSSEKSEMKIGENTLPAAIAPLKRFLINSDHSQKTERGNAQVKVGSFSIYEDSVYNDLREMTQSKMATIKSALDLEKANQRLEALRNLEPALRKERLAQFCDQYVNPRYSVLLGTVLASKGMQVSKAGYRLPNGQLISHRESSPTRGLASQAIAQKHE